ncbi:MAG: hypothetical protein ABI821_17675 [Pseudomonadota bacterium]
MSSSFLKIGAAVVSCGLLVPWVHADAADDRTAGMNMGAILAWRLGPEVVEERCRSADPAGVAIRQAALHTWLDKNATLIRSVDERIAEVVPLLSPQEPKDEFVASVKSHVRDMILEPLASAKNPEEVTALCKAEADPAKARWNNPGMPMVAMALAELYDWKVKKTAK